MLGHGIGTIRRGLYRMDRDSLENRRDDKSSSRSRTLTSEQKKVMEDLDRLPSDRCFEGGI